MILIRNIVAGLDGVPPDGARPRREWGTGGRASCSRSSSRSRPAIVAGIRIATVTTIGLITVTALIGQGGLGQFMIDGFQRDFRTPLTVGIILRRAGSRRRPPCRAQRLAAAVGTRGEEKELGVDFLGDVWNWFGDGSH